MQIESKTDITAEIEQCIKTGMLDQLALLLAHYEGDDLGDQFQRAFRLCLDQGNIQFFARFYLARKSSKKVLPVKKLLLKAIGHSVSIYKDDRLEKRPFKQLEPDVLKALYEMLVCQQMVSEFLAFYQDLQMLAPLDPQAKPSDQTLFISISLTEQYLKYFPNGEEHEKFKKAREKIKEIFQI